MYRRRLAKPPAGNKYPLKNKRVGALGRGVAAGLLTIPLTLCLFVGTTAGQGTRYFGRVVVELQAVFRDSATQWMVFICCAVYFITLELLRRRTTSGHFWHCRNPQVWVAAFLVFTGLHYAFNYKSASGSTYALMLLGGAVLGKGAAVWARWQNRPARLRTTEAPLTPTLSPLSQVTSSGFATFSPSDAEKATQTERVSADPARRVFISMLLVLLAAAALLKSETGLQYQYRGQGRWTGPWDNPNIFGMLMGVGCVLAAGRLLILNGVEKKRHLTPALPPDEAGREAITARDDQRTANIEHRTFGRNVWQWSKFLFFVIAAVVCGIGLLKSYSRGAWVGAAVGLGYTGWSWWRTRTHLTPALSPHPMGGEGESFSRHSCNSRLPVFLRRNWLPTSIIVVCGMVLMFWNFRHTEQATARRAFSAANINDFSWRNRVAAWEGAVQMMASKPFTGFGWNQPERVYDQFYRAPKVTESAAMQMNDYFTLGTTLGIPALVCFLVYVGMSLTRNTERKDRTSPRPSPRRGEGEKQAPARREVDFLSAPGGRGEGQGEVSAVGTNSGDCMSETGWKRCPTTDWLRVTCRAGAIVLLVGFWFDGGLFKLATGSVFWILLELGRSEAVELLESESVKTAETL